MNICTEAMSIVTFDGTNKHVGKNTMHDFTSYYNVAMITLLLGQKRDFSKQTDNSIYECLSLIFKLPFAY